MKAWVVRPEREGEPIDALKLEEVEAPEPGPLEVIVKVMAAGVNYDNVWAALGEPVSVFGFGDHPQYGHHIGGSDGAGIVEQVGVGVSEWAPGDEVVIQPNQDGLIWGYETTWGSFAQYAKVRTDQLLRKPAALTWEEAASYALTYFTAYRMLLTRAGLKAGDRVLIWGAGGGLGVFACQLCALAGAQSVGVVSSAEKGALAVKCGATAYIDRTKKEDMKSFARRVRELIGGAPDVVFEHVGQATFPTSVYVAAPGGKIVICGASSGFQLDFDVRHLWMRQKEIIGSHMASVEECARANELVEQGLIRPVLWRTFGFDGVGEAHQLMRDNRHLGKIAILVGAGREGEGKTADGPGAIRAEGG